jgi:hypothetical protein
MAVPVRFEEDFLRQIMCPAAIPRQAKTPGRNADLIPAENLGKQAFVGIHVRCQARIAQNEHNFLICQPFGALPGHTVQLRVKGGFIGHARIIVAGRYVCREGLVRTL